MSNTGINCYPQVAGPLYPTIKAALDVVPIAATASHVVVVCPGTYPEQLKITKNVTITGVLRDGTDPVEIDGNSSQVRIVPPAAGLVRDDSFLGNVAAQVSAQNITDLNLTNLDIDGTGVGCPLGTDGSPMPTAGIALYGVGITGTAHKATISKTLVHNQIGVCGGARSFTGDGIQAEKSWFTLDANNLNNVDYSLIHQIEGVSKITNNALNQATYGIWLYRVTETYGASLTGSTVSSNVVTSASQGIYLVQSADVLVSLNTLTNWTGDGIVVFGLGARNQILSNKVVDSWHGIYLNSGPSQTLVSKNTVLRSGRIAIIDRWGEGGNVITGNTINQSPTGIWVYAPLNDVINPNSYYNTPVLTTISAVPEVP